MAHRGRRSLPRSAGGRRRKVWARQNSQSNVPTGAFNALDLLGDFNDEYGADLVGCTCVRIRMRVFVESATTDDTNISVAGLGVRVADDSAVASADTLDPLGPLSDLHADWMFFESTSFTGSAALMPFMVDHYFDVKAMRKFEELGQGLYLFVDHDNPTNAASINVTSSVLLALP